MNHEWLSELLLALADRAGGPAGVVLLAGLLATATALLLVRAARRSGLSDPLIGFGLALSAAAISDRFVPRPQLFSYLGLAVLLERVGAGALWFLPPLQLIWTNLHGPVIGLGTSTLLLLGGGSDREPLRKRLIVLGLVALASIAHPAGPKVLLEYVGHLGEGGYYRQVISEWRTLTQATAGGLPQAPFAWVLMGLAAALSMMAAARGAWRDRWGPLLLLLLLAAAPLTAVRNRDILAIAILPLAGWFLAPRSTPKGGVPAPGRRAGPVVGAGLLAAAAALLLIPGLGWLRFEKAWPPRIEISDRGRPRAAVDFLEREGWPGRKWFNTYADGGYLVSRLPPDRRIFIDGRYFVYGEALVHDYLMLRDGAPGSRDRLQELGADLLLLGYPAPDGYRALAAQAWNWPEWGLVYWDDENLVFVRSTAVDQAWLAAHRCRRFDPTLGATPDDPGWWSENFREIARESIRMIDASGGGIRPTLALALALERAGRDADALLIYRDVLARRPGHRAALDAEKRIMARHPTGLPPSRSRGDLRREFG